MSSSSEEKPVEKEAQKQEREVDPRETSGIRAILIIEVMGRPPEHLTETLENMIKQIDGEKGIRVVEKKIHEPVEIKDKKDFYTNFAEIEVETEQILHVSLLMFKYMPAHIEILSPELIALTNNGWNEIINELARRLHQYDEIARVIQVEKAILEKKLKEILGSNKSKDEEK